MGKPNSSVAGRDNPIRVHQPPRADGNHVEQDGLVINSVKGIIIVELESGQIVQAHLGGKIRQNKINIVPGDRVRVKLSPYDLTRGIVSRRL